MNKNTFLVLGGLIILLVGFILGSTFTLSYNFGKNLGCQLALKEIETKYQQKIEEGVPLGPELEEEMTFSYIGEITEIENQTIVLKARIPGVAPLEEERFETKNVKITEATEIVKLVEKTPEEMEAPASPGEIVKPFKEEKISLLDLNLGDEIIVRSEEDIGGKEEFTASKITKIPK